ncbi:MAG: translocation/assembly module TamB domain-containing protein [Bdellovibrionales bacterium]|nr:translocation/assembly module TamB domain-containing protein [Bdellovibrionales bacterium]
MKKKSKGAKLALLGVIIGLVIGLGLLILKEYLANQLVQLLRDEVANSCDCQFTVDSASVSLLAASAVANKPTVIFKDKPALEFKKIKASFDISDIKNHKIWIKQLHLIEGKSDGVTPGAPTYEVVKYFAEPIDPARDTPDRWRLKLKKLRVSKLSFTEQLGSQTLEAEEGSLVMTRTPDNNFDLSAEIGKLALVNSETNKFSLGSIQTDLYLHDDYVQIHKIKLNEENLNFAAKARINMDKIGKITGETNYALNTEYFAKDLPVSSTLKGEASLTGNQDDVVLVGEVTSDPDPTLLKLAGQTVLNLSSLLAKFKVNYKNEKLKIEIPEFSAVGENAYLSSKETISVNDQILSGSIESKIDSLELDYIKLNSISFEIGFEGTSTDPRLNLSGKIEEVLSGDRIIPDVILSAQITKDKILFKLEHNSEQRGLLSLSGGIDLTDSQNPKLVDTRYQLTNFSLAESHEASTTSELNKPRLRFTGNGSIEGLLSQQGLISHASLKAISTSRDKASELTLDLKLEDARLLVTAKDQLESINGKLEIDFLDRKVSSFSLDLKTFKPGDFIDKVKCFEFSGKLNYKFLHSEPKTGSGNLDLNNLSFGCDPYGIELQEPVSTKIIDGGINISKLNLAGVESTLETSGSISLNKGWNLSTNGDFKLNSLLTFFPSVDDFYGKAKIALNTSGKIDSPDLTGNIRIADAGFAIEAKDLLGRKFDIELTFKEGTLYVDKFYGIINNGEFDLSGFFDPINITNSSLLVDFSDLSINPSKEASVTASGSLALEQFESEEIGIAGSIEVNSADIRKDFNLNSIIKEITNFFKSSKTNRKDLNENELPDIGLAVHINANRNIFLFSNLANIELKGDIDLGGTLQQSIIRGNLNAISGWFGIKDRRFEITSGQVIFDPAEEEPVLSVIAETTTISRLGDAALVIMEAYGPLSNPDIKMTSDSGLPESEILSLLTQTGTFTSNKALERGGGFGVEELNIFGQSDQWLVGIISNLTKIDEINIEPDYNEERETTEPSIIAIKYLTERLSLVGQTFLGDNKAPAKASAALSLTKKLSTSAGVETATQQEREAVFIDIVYDILSNNKDAIKIDFIGNQSFSSKTLLSELRLGAESHIPAEDIPALAKAFEKFYIRNGFSDAEVEGACNLEKEYCKHATFLITEKHQSLIRDIKIETDIPLEEFGIPNFVNEYKGKAASREHIEEIIKELVIKLRSEGYIKARIGISFESLPYGKDKLLSLNILAGSPVSFSFSGNTHFSAEEFLNTINIFNRRQPFGDNTINILIQNIERLYREQGYLFTTINYNKSFDQKSNRTFYILNINEDSQIEVSEVSFEGLNSITKEEIIEEFKLFGDEAKKNLLSPKFAIDEQLRANANSIKSIYHERGFNSADVKFKLVPHLDDNTIQVFYLITEGERKILDKIIFKGLPSDLDFKDKIHKNVSLQQTNSKINSALSRLKDHGYFNPIIATELSVDNSILEIIITPGSRESINKIYIKGLDSVTQKVVKKHLQIKPGDFWNRDLVNQSKIALLKTGLFNKVSIESKKTSDDKLDLDINLSEKNLRTLKVGTGINSEYGLRMFLDATDKEIFGDGRSLNLRIDTYYDDTEAGISKGIANLRYFHPDLFSSGFDFSQDFRFQKLDASTLPFDYDRWATSSTFYSTFDSQFYTSFGYTFLQDNLDSVPNDAILSPHDTGVVNTSYISLAGYWGHKDNSFNPDAGFSLSIENNLATEVLGSESNYYQVDGNFSFLLPIPAFDKRLIFANNSRAASSWEFSNTNTIPISQRFFTGGRASVRGFRENSLGPKGEDGTVLGGDLLITNNFELRYLATDTIETHLFVDAGSVFLRDYGVNTNEIRESYGLGLRFRSPIGPIGFDLGFPIDERPGEPSTRFHFYIGGAF